MAKIRKLLFDLKKIYDTVLKIPPKVFFSQMKTSARYLEFPDKSQSAKLCRYNFKEKNEFHFCCIFVLLVVSDCDFKANETFLR